MRNGRVAMLVLALVASTAVADTTTLDLTAPDLAAVSLATGARSTKLVGSEIYARDVDLGQIDDVIVDLQTARVRAVIVSIGGLFRHRLVALPAAAIKVGTNNRLTIDATKEQLEAAPPFEYAEKSAEE